jgi:AraC family transcriptional regulator of adaptative response/methylated-DNA-[protein]-cysteine methyltransferase
MDGIRAKLEGEMLIGDLILADELNEEACWSAVLSRDEGAAGAFVFGVVTTGIFCRPSCPARRPKRQNLRYFGTAAEARRAGFRPCKRCVPDGVSPHERQAEIVRQVCRQIEAAEDMPSLTDLSRDAELSPFHLHRLFKRVTGVTPKAYSAAVRARRMRGGLAAAGSVTEAIYEAGYASSSRFYESADEILGMAPRQYRAGGKGVRMDYAIGRSWLGAVLVGATTRGICAILIDDGEAALIAALRARFPAAEIAPATVDFADRLAEVLAMIEQPQMADRLPLDILGTAFQQRIWHALRTIPYGKTATYVDIAQHIGAPKAVRAVAGACAANPIAVAIPCHRVIRADGNLAGYRWGLKRKQMLLAREAGTEAAPPPRPQPPIRSD